jgi:hypothetical protein
MGMIRTTRALSLRTVCRNSTFPRAGAKGISSETRDQRRKGLRIASNAPPALSLSKVQNSTNSLPCPLTPRTNTGMARESRTQRRRSSAGCLAAVGPPPRRIGNHRSTEHRPLGWITRDDIIDWMVCARSIDSGDENPDWKGRRGRLFRCAVGEKRVCAEEGVNRGSEESGMSSNGFRGPDDYDADHRSGQRFGYASLRGYPFAPSVPVFALGALRITEPPCLGSLWRSLCFSCRTV